MSVVKSMKHLAGVLCAIAGALLTLTMVMPASAEQVARLYDAAVPVATQGIEDRDRALASALEEVLVRVSGVPDVAKRPGMAEVFKNPQRLVQQYRYELAPPAAAVPGEAAAAPGMQLRVTFDAPAVEKSLLAAGLPVWGGDRPLSLVLVALDNGSERGLVGADVDASVRNAIEEGARRRGVPVMLPLLDLEDQATLNYETVSTGNTEQILQGAARYATDAVVVGRAVYKDALWQGQWTLHRQDGEITWQSSDASLGGALAKGMHGLADALSQRLAPVVTDTPPATGAAPAGDGSITLRVTGITDIDQFASVERYLSGLTTVSRLTSSQFDPAGVAFQVHIRGAVSYLQQAIAFGSVLMPDTAMQSDPGLAGQQTQVLYYRLGP